jgi:hypothetical protein
MRGRAIADYARGGMMRLVADELQWNSQGGDVLKHSVRRIRIYERVGFVAFSPVKFWVLAS